MREVVTMATSLRVIFQLSLRAEGFLQLFSSNRLLQRPLKSIPEHRTNVLHRDTASSFNETLFTHDFIKDSGDQ